MVVIGGGCSPKVLIKVGRCIKMLQISTASLVVSSILQVARVNIFALPIYLHIFVGLRSFTVLQ